MKKALKGFNQFITEYRVLFGIVVIAGVITTYANLPGKVTANEVKIIEVSKEVTVKTGENKDALQKLASFVNKYAEVQTIREEAQDKREEARETARDRREDLLLELIKEQRKANGN